MVHPRIKLAKLTETNCWVVWVVGLLDSLGGCYVAGDRVTVFTASLDEDLPYCKEKILEEDYLCGERRRLRGCRTLYIGNNIWLLKL